MIVDRQPSRYPIRSALAVSATSLALFLAGCTANTETPGGDDTISPNGCMGTAPATWRPVEPGDDVSGFAGTLGTTPEDIQHGMIGVAKCQPGIRYDELIQGYQLRVHNIGERCLAFGPATPDKHPRVDRRYEEVQAVCV